MSLVTLPSLRRSKTPIFWWHFNRPGVMQHRSVESSLILPQEGYRPGGGDPSVLDANYPPN